MVRDNQATAHKCCLSILRKLALGGSVINVILVIEREKNMIEKPCLRKKISNAMKSRLKNLPTVRITLQVLG